jgi:hypothetical protein
VAGSTLVYDVLAPDEPTDDEALHDWIAKSESMPPVPLERLPDGPEEGAVDERSIQALLPLFGELLKGAPIRRRSSKALAEDEAS